MTTITYDRKMKKWKVQNGRSVETFPAGDEGQQAAQQFALKLDDPQAHAAATYLAYDLFRGNQPLQDRIWRAATLVAKGAVRPPYQVGEEPHTVARVKAQTTANTPQHNLHHIVKRSPASRRYSCDCFDFTNDTAPKVQGQKLCKHILAYKIMKVITRELPAWPELDARQKWILERDARADERIRQNRIAKRKRIANRGPNIHEQNRRKARQDGDGARQWARTAAANGTKTVPAHIHNRMGHSEETEKAKEEALEKLYGGKYTGEEIDDMFSYG